MYAYCRYIKVLFWLLLQLLSFVFFLFFLSLPFFKVAWGSLLVFLTLGLLLNYSQIQLKSKPHWCILCTFDHYLHCVCYCFTSHGHIQYSIAENFLWFALLSSWGESDSNMAEASLPVSHIAYCTQDNSWIDIWCTYAHSLTHCTWL